MKVVFLVRDLGLGGVERCVALVAEGLAQRGFDIHILLLGGSRNLWGKHLVGVTLHDLSGVWQGRQPWTWPRGWRAARGVLRDADVVIAATFLMPLYMAWAASLGLGKRLIGWVHGPKAELDAFARMHPIHRHACQMLYRRIGELVFVSAHARDSMARWIGLPVQAGWRVLPNFVEPPSLLSPSPCGGEGWGEGVTKPLQILFVGRIAEEKQPHLWLDTLEALQAQGIAARLTIVGDGPLQGWLSDEASRRNLREQLDFAGRRDNVADYLLRADVLLLTSSFEGCPLVVLEAMQQGLPVVSTHAGGVYELFGERMDDFIATETSGPALAGKIIAQLPRQTELSAWLRMRASHYTPQASLAQWMALLQPSDPQSDQTDSSHSTRSCS